MATHSDDRLDTLCKQLNEKIMGAAMCVNAIIATARERQGDNTPPVMGGAERTAATTVAMARPFLDESTLSVVWNANVLPLGHTQAFWLLARLARSANQYVTHVDLLQEIWEDEFTDAATLRAGVCRLRHKLRDGGMPDLADAIVGHHGRYMLDLNRPLVTQT